MEEVTRQLDSQSDKDDDDNINKDSAFEGEMETNTDDYDTYISADDENSLQPQEATCGTTHEQERTGFYKDFDPSECTWFQYFDKQQAMQY